MGVDHADRETHRNRKPTCRRTGEGDSPRMRRGAANPSPGSDPLPYSIGINWWLIPASKPNGIRELDLTRRSRNTAITRKADRYPHPLWANVSTRTGRTPYGQ
jgi:hypothetical protein